MGRFDDREPVDGSEELFVARDADHGGARRALRVMSSTPARAAALRARVREAAMLSHPHLARWVTVGEEDGRVLVARSWLPGPALGPGMDARDASMAMLDVLDALAHAHWHDLHHGAVRPSKLLRDEDGRVVLVDLGLASHGTVEGDLRGVVDTLEALVSEIPEGIAAVVASTHAGAYPTARDLQEALKRSLQVSKPPPVWGRWMLAGSLVVAAVVAVLLCWGARPGEMSVAEVAQPESTRVQPVPPPPLPVPEPEPEPPPVPQPVVPRPEVAPSPRPAVIAPPEPAPEPEPEPEPEVIEVPAVAPPPPPEPEPEPAPEPEPQPEPEPEPQAMPVALPATGKWEVVPGAGDSAVLRLIADARVVDRGGRGGRPVVEVLCDKGRVSVTLHPGVTTVERILAENGVDSNKVRVRVEVGTLGTQDMSFRTQEGAPLSLPRRSSDWVARSIGQNRVRMAYTPFASDVVIAEFDWRGLGEAWRLAGACGEP